MHPDNKVITNSPPSTSALSPSVRADAKASNERVGSGALPPIRALVLKRCDPAQPRPDPHERWPRVKFRCQLPIRLLALLLLKSMGKESERIATISSQTHDPLDTQNAHIEDSHKVIFRGVDTLAKPLVEDTKAAKWELSNAGMQRCGMSKTLIVMFM
jgi:hypothetical protein